jgi:hypothetical protein
LIALQFQQQGKRDIGLVMIDINKALECKDIIFHTKELGRSFGHTDYTKWKWEYLFHNQISKQALVGHVSLNNLLECGLFEIFPALSNVTTSTPLKQLCGTIMMDFDCMQEQQCSQTFNLKTGSWDWRE